MVIASLKHLAKFGIARETTGRNYGRIYAYDKYLKILNEGTEPLNENRSTIRDCAFQRTKQPTQP